MLLNSQCHPATMGLVLVLLSLTLLVLCTLFTSSLQRSSPKDHASEKKRYEPALRIEIPLVPRGVGGSMQYLVPLQIGEPPQTLYLIADTGSDSTWVYCDRLACQENSYSYSPCIFDHSRSYTFNPLSCSSTHEHCNYTIEYEDRSSTSGYWVNETITVKSQTGLDVKFSNVTIGCSSGNSTTITNADGILGLAPDQPSFTSSVAPKLGMRFSYIFSRDSKLASYHDRLIFGDTERYGINRELMQYTNLVHADVELYFVEVLNIFIDDMKLDISKSVWKLDDSNGSGGIILDTGSVLTYVPRVAFEAIHAAYAEVLLLYNNVNVTQSKACFDSLAPEFDAAEFPHMSIEFEGGARLNLDEDNLFNMDHEGFKCLAVEAVDEDEDEGSAIGNTFQRGYYWEYDLLNRRVGFAPLS